MLKPLIAVSGINGQLGSELQKLASSFNNFQFLFADKNKLNLSDFSSIQSFFHQTKPDCFINCAAYTAVDKAEEERNAAYTINAEAVGIIANLCEQYNTTLIHLSTDYVFNGNDNKPYKPDDATDPINYYGYTKLEGEKLALKNCSNTIIIRTSWVYSEFGHNFVKTMLRLMKERKEINVVNDQYGSPTYAADLAEAIIKIVSQQIHQSSAVNAQLLDADYQLSTGIFHYCNDGAISWYDFAMAIKNEIKSSCIINSISTAQFPTPAKRPGYSVMSKEKIVSVFKLPVKNWQESLKKCIARLNYTASE